MKYVRSEDDDTVLYVGVHGPMWQLVDKSRSHRFTRILLDNTGKPIALVCHLRACFVT